MIDIDNLTVAAGKFTLERLRFTVAAGQYAVLMGRTGSGKTTILETICGLKRAQSGTVRLLGQDVTTWKPAARGVGYVPQDRALFPTMTVGDHLAFAMVVQRWDAGRIAERVRELADMLGLARLLDRKPLGLSGGESQRVALGRALSAQPRILLLDEPLSALDDATRLDMCEVLRTIRQRTGVTTLHVTHNQAEAAQLADRLFVLEDGMIAEHPLDHLTNGAVRRAEVRP
jgi:ABC-type sugar transport system ATPase subunit